MPPDSSSKSEDSLEALRDDEDWLSPLVLDDSCKIHALDTPLQHTLHMAGQHATSASTARLAAMQSNQKPTTGVFIHRKKAESRPYHITSIHPNRNPMVAHKQKPRIRSAEFLRQNQQPEWSKPITFTKKPLSELLNEINAEKLKRKTNNASPATGNPHHKDSDATIYPQLNHLELNPPLVHSNTNSASRDGSSDNGCMQSCDKCLPGSRMTVVPLMDSADYGEIPANDHNFIKPTVPATSKGNKPIISWFRSKKKAGSRTPVRNGSKSQAIHTNSGGAAPTQTLNSVMMEKERESIAVVKKKLMNLEKGKDSLETAVNTMKQEVSQANEKRDAALVEVFELKIAIEEMAKKLKSLERYCQTLQHNRPDHHHMNNVMISTVPLDDQDAYGDHDETEDDDHDKMLRSALGSSMSTQFSGPSKKEFYHAVTEARIGVKQFCRTLLQQIQEQSTTEKIEGILQPYNVKVAPKVSKSVRYHLEAVINEAFYEDFENIKFQKSGTNCVLDPRQRPQAFYQTYLGMSQMGWSELVSRESGAYSQSFDAFCDHKMNRVEQVLNWEGRWPDDLTRSFFVAAKWVWLLHLLAFSFHNPALIFRVGSEALFNSQFMEELVVEQTSSKTSSTKVNSTTYGVDPPTSLNMKTMVMPGFFFNNYEVIKCKVLSRPPFTPITPILGLGDNKAKSFIVAPPHVHHLIK